MKNRLTIPRRPCRGLAPAVCVQVSLLVAGCGHGGGRGGARDAEAIRVERTLGMIGDTPGRFVTPRAMETDGRLLWVIDKTARVQGLSPASGRCVVLWRMPAWEVGKPTGFGLGMPLPSLAAETSSDELLYIADTHYHRVMIYEPPEVPDEVLERARQGPGVGGDYVSEPAKLLRSFGEYGTGPGQFIYPTDVALLMSKDGTSVERLYVSEYGGNDRVSVFDNRLNFLFSFGHNGDGAGETPEDVQFDRPQSLAFTEVNGEVELIITDAWNHRVGRFTPEGKLIAWYGSRAAAGDGLGQFRHPYGIHILGDGTALIAEMGNNRVQRIELATGKGLEVWGKAGRGEGELATPWAVTTMDGTAFVLDTGNNRILAFEP